MYKCFLMLSLILSIADLKAMSSLEQLTKTLMNGVNPVKMLVLHELRKDLFLESGKNATVERFNQRMLYIHNNEVEENERKTIPKEDREALFHQNGGSIVDRRILVKDCFESPFKAICFLKGTYNITKRDEFVYFGTGFRNGLNQIVTAGHNLFVESKDIKNACKKKEFP